MPGARYAATVVAIAMTGAPSLVPRSVTAALYRSPDTTVQLAQLAPTEVPVPGASSLTAISCVSPSDCFGASGHAAAADPVGLGSSGDGAQGRQVRQDDHAPVGPLRDHLLERGPVYRRRLGGSEDGARRD